MSTAPALPPIQSVVAEVHRRLQRVQPNALLQSRIYHFILTDENGGGDFYIAIGNGMAAVGRGAPQGSPNCSVTLSTPDAVGLITGTLEPISAYYKGRFKVRGEMSHAVYLGTLLRAAGQAR